MFYGNAGQNIKINETQKHSLLFTWFIYSTDLTTNFQERQCGTVHTKSISLTAIAWTDAWFKLFIYPPDLTNWSHTK